MKTTNASRVNGPLAKVAFVGFALTLTGCTVSMQPDEPRVYREPAPPPRGPAVVDRSYPPPAGDRGYDTSAPPADTYANTDEPPPYVPAPQEAYQTYEQDLNPYGHWV